MNRSIRGSPTPRRGLWRELRLLVLLAVLFLVALKTYFDRRHSTDWNDPLFIALYPIAADDSTVTTRYIGELNGESFAAIDEFFARETHRYGVQEERPVRIRLKGALTDRPPEHLPQDGPFATALWSLKLRWWASWRTRGADEPADVVVFVLYHDPGRNPVVPHSLGLSKGLIGVVYAFADSTMNEPNNFVIAHEIMHTLGASDKYDAANDMPVYPIGYGDPDQRPLWPQQHTEVMGGRRVVSPNNAEQPAGLGEAIIGSASALEIGLGKHGPR
jgi:hypothetical protein